MRVTSGMLTINFTERLHQRGRILWDAYDKIASGKRVRKPGDDPAASVRIVQLQRQLSESEQYHANTTESVLWLELTDNALHRLGEITHRGRELAISGSSDTMSEASRGALADEVDQLFSHTIQEANTSVGERHLFAGQRTLTSPYEVTEVNEYEFLGDTGDIVRQTGRNSYLTVNVTGDRVIDPLLDVLSDLSAALRTGDVDAMNKDILSRLDENMDDLLAARAEVGAKIQRLQRGGDKLLDEKVNLTAQLSDRQDADLADSLLNLQLAEAGYQAALTATSRMMQQSLVDYLR